MRVSSLAHLYRVRVRRRLVQELLALIGIAAGVALVFTALVANASLIGPMEHVTSAIAGKARYQVSGRGGQPFEATLVQRIEQVPDVRVAAPVLDVRAILRGPDADRPITLLGADDRLTRLNGTVLGRFKGMRMGATRTLLLPLPLARAVGAPVATGLTVQTGGRTTSGIPALPLPGEELGGLAQGAAAVAALPYAQSLSALAGKVTRILVQPDPGHDAQVKAELERVVGPGLYVRDANADVDVFRQAAVPISQSTALFSLFAMLVGFLFALSAVLLTVPQRQRFIGDLRLAGHPPLVVVQVMVFDALVLGTAGAAAGLVIGDLLSQGVFGAAPGYLAFAFPVGGDRIVTWSSVALAGAAGVLAACVAVLAPLRDIFSRRPTTYGPAAPESRWPPRLLAAGLVCLVSSAALVALRPGTAIGGLVLLTAGLLLVLPSLVNAGVEAVSRVGHRVSSPVPVLAVMELRARRTQGRTYALAATAAIAVFASVSISGSQADLQRGLYDAGRQLDRNAAIWITFPGAPNTFATTPFVVANGVTQRLAAAPGVSSVRQYRGGFLDVGNRRVWVMAPPNQAPFPVPAGHVTRGDATRATADLRRGGAVVLSTGVAKALGVSVGDRVRLPSPIPVTLRVAALTSNFGWPPGVAIVNATDYARAWGSPTPSALLIGLGPGAHPLAVAAHERHLLGAAAHLTVETAAQRGQRQNAATRQGLSRTTQIATFVLWTAVLALATAMAGMLWQRRPAVARLKVDGLTEVQLWKALLLECGVLLGVGSLAGALLALAGQHMLTHGLIAITDFPVVAAGGVEIAATRVAIMLAVALAMLAVPGWLTVRVRPNPGRHV